MNTIRLTLAASLLCFAHSAAAQTVSVPRIENSKDGSVSLGLAALSAPNYAGAEAQQTRVLPYVEVYNYKGFDFIPFTASYSLIDYLSGDGLWAWGIKAGPQVNYEFGREEDEAAELSGLGDLDGSLYAGAYSRIRLGPIGVRIEGGQDLVDGTDGSKLDMSIGTRLPVGKGSLTGGYTANWGSEDYNQSYFGITAAQAAGSNFNAAQISDGIYANTATLLFQYPVKKDWEILTLASYRQYVDEIKDSPIISAQTGSAEGLTVLVGVSRKFSFTNK